ncbi:putative ORFan [Tupanvirus deep ocean]|uniref:ORFan n=2 Tax=Tupanvirus TaxID=2094720 RepID=A0AC62A7J9_9VIRU|nr:putative ORFan [Tupanvirus deep ocean]QKU33588.1 putative ORFan [Tupanvirus deep ocean]
MQISSTLPFITRDKHINHYFDTDFSDDCVMYLQESLSSLLSDKKPVDCILSSLVSIQKKSLLVHELLCFLKNSNINYCAGISENTMSILLENKEDTNEYLYLFKNLVEFSNTLNLKIFTYNHLYHLVLQMWMDLPQTFSNEFRKTLIYIGFNENLPVDVIKQIKINAGIWFANVGKDPNITNLIEWLCEFDTTGELSTIRHTIEKTMVLSIESTKAFQKQYNMTKEEYNIQQNKAKEKGLCRKIRNGEECPHGVGCMFYHGKLQETYGVQICRNGDSCSRLPTGECKFVHTPTKKQLETVINFYNSLKREGDGFLVEPSMVRWVDTQCKLNPFIILKKDGRIGDHVHYSIPVCSGCETNEFGVSYDCNKPVKFMTKLEGQPANFYCCYEHMIQNEDEESCYYSVKQNILNEVFPVLGE